MEGLRFSPVGGGGGSRGPPHTLTIFLEGADETMVTRSDGMEGLHCLEFVEGPFIHVVQGPFIYRHVTRESLVEVQLT